MTARDGKELWGQTSAAWWEDARGTDDGTRWEEDPGMNVRRMAGRSSGDVGARDGNYKGWRVHGSRKFWQPNGVDLEKERAPGT